MTTRSPPLFAACILSLLLAAPSARADAPTAEELFREGRALMDAGSYAPACAKFAESQRMDPAAGTLLNMAECEERQGLLATAAGTYKEAAVAAALRNRKDWERLALDRIEALVPLVPVWTLRLAPGSRAAGVVLTLDERTIRTDDGDTSRPLDPGPHTLVASAPGRRPWTTTATLVKGARLTVTVPPLEEERARSIDPAPGASEGKASWARPTGLAVGAVGTAGVIFGTVAGILALGAHDDAVANCPRYPDICSAAGTSHNERAQGWATASTIGLGAGLGLVAAGAFLAFAVPRF